MTKAAKLYAQWQRAYDHEYRRALEAGKGPWHADQTAVTSVHTQYPEYSRRHIRRSILPR